MAPIITRSTLLADLENSLRDERSLATICQRVKTDAVAQKLFFEILEDPQWIRYCQPKIFKILTAYYKEDPQNFTAKVEELYGKLKLLPDLKRSLDESVQSFYSIATSRSVREVSTFTICTAIMQKESLTVLHLLNQPDLSHVDFNAVRKAIIECEDSAEAVQWFPQLSKDVKLKLLDHGPQGNAILVNASRKIPVIIRSIGQDRELFSTLLQPGSYKISPITNPQVLYCLGEQQHWLSDLLKIYQSDINAVEARSLDAFLDQLLRCPDEELSIATLKMYQRLFLEDPTVFSRYKFNERMEKFLIETFMDREEMLIAHRSLVLDLGIAGSDFALKFITKNFAPQQFLDYEFKKMLQISIRIPTWIPLVFQHATLHPDWLSPSRIDSHLMEEFFSKNPDPNRLKAFIKAYPNFRSALYALAPLSKTLLDALLDYHREHPSGSSDTALRFLCDQPKFLQLLGSPKQYIDFILKEEVNTKYLVTACETQPEWIPIVLNECGRMLFTGLASEAKRSPAEFMRLLQNCPDALCGPFLLYLVSYQPFLLKEKIDFQPGLLDMFAQAGKSSIVFKTLWDAEIFRENRIALIPPNVRWLLSDQTEIDLQTITPSTSREQLILLPFTKPDTIYQIVHNENILDHFTPDRIEAFKVYLDQMVEKLTRTDLLTIQEELEDVPYPLLAFFTKEQPELIRPLLNYFPDYQSICIIPLLRAPIPPSLLEKPIEVRAVLIKYATTFQKSVLIEQIDLIPKFFLEWNREAAQQMELEKFRVLHAALCNSRIPILIDRLENAFLLNTEEPQLSLFKKIFTSCKARIQEVQAQAQEVYAIKNMSVQNEIPEDFMCAISGQVMREPMLLPKSEAAHPDIWIDHSSFIEYITVNDEELRQQVVQGSQIKHPFTHVLFDRSLYIVNKEQQQRIERWKSDLTNS